MKIFPFESKIARQLTIRLDEAAHAILRVTDRVKRADLERDARYAGSLLAAVTAAGRAMAEAPDTGKLAAAAASYMEKLDRAEQAVLSLHERTAGLAPPPEAAPAEGAPAANP